jgi:hypothetical protein
MNPKQRLLMWYAAKGAFQICNGAGHRENDNTLTGKRELSCLIIL